MDHQIGEHLQTRGGLYRLCQQMNDTTGIQDLGAIGGHLEACVVPDTRVEFSVT